MPAPDGSGAVVVALDLRTHKALVEHSDGRVGDVALTPDRPVAEVTQGVLGAVRELAGPVEIDPAPQEVSWSVPLDEDFEHASYDPGHVRPYFAAATSAAIVLAAFRAPYRGRSTPVNAWWGSFDLSVSLFSGRPADPPAETSSCATRWTPRRSRSVGGRETQAIRAQRSMPTRIPAPPSSRRPRCPAGARWDDGLGEYVLDWADVRSSADPHAAALSFALSVFQHACAVCQWDPRLPASAEGNPPPLV